MPRKDICTKVERLARQQWALEKRAEEIKTLAKSLKDQVARPLAGAAKEAT